MSLPQLRQRPLLAETRFSEAVHPVLQHVLGARGVATDEQLQSALNGLLAPDTLKGLPEAVALLLDARVRDRRLLIVADYDADGATSCALGLIGLRQLGFRQVEYLVPNRFEYGYGLTPPIVELAQGKQPDILITVDNGIASHAGVQRARELGMEVLITDHHLPAATLPAATAIVNPNQHGCPFASKALAGVGVMFYLLLALRRALREQGAFTAAAPEPNLASLLDLVALGTVADVVPLDDNNRRLVKHGLQLIRQGKCRPGITALLEAGGRNPARCVASDLGFAAGPRLNAAGRLDDMGLGIECLLADEPIRARHLAQQLDALNRDRRLIEQDMQQSALQQLDTLGLDDSEHSSLCLYDPSWHQGVIGILASRLKDRLHCPVLIFADGGFDANGDEVLKGSGRSIAGVHLRDLLDSVATANPGLLDKFGGHAMAAGLSIARDRFDEFAAAFDAVLRRSVDPALLQREVWHDGELPADCFTLDFAERLRTLVPWGQHFPEPLFVGEFDVRGQRVLGERHLKLSVGIGPRVIDAIAFGQGDQLRANARRVKLLYKLDVNEYRGERQPQLLVDHLEYL